MIDPVIVIVDVYDDDNCLVDSFKDSERACIISFGIEAEDLPEGWHYELTYANGKTTVHGQGTFDYV